MTVTMMIMPMMMMMIIIIIIIIKARKIGLSEYYPFDAL
jgi:hypothetical protein